jgi:hypothetical protein
VGLRRSRGAALAALLASAFAVPALAQVEGGWSVVSARMVADLTADDGSADVTIRYVLSGTPRGAPLPLDRTVPVELLGVADTRVAEVSVEGTGPVVLWPTRGVHRAAGVELPAGAAMGDTAALRISYTVEGAVPADGARLRGRVPVLSGPSAPAPGAGGGFEARLLVPPAWRLSEGFPSTLRAEEAGVWSVALPVSPAFVGFRGRADGTWRPGLTLFVDVLTLTILTVFTFFGWRHLRSIAA